MAVELRDYQSLAIDRLRQSLASGKRRPLLAAPTGAGKTRVASAIIESARSKSKRAAFVVPALSLIDQTVEAFWKEGVRDLGVIQADHAMTDWSRPVQICSVDTLTRRGFPEVDVVLVDEAHRMNVTIEKWMASAKIPFIGLSATPGTKGLGKLYDDLIVVATTQQLIDRGYLSPFKVFAPAHPDLSKVKIVAGDYHEGQLSEAMSKPELIADVVQTWLQLGEGRPTACFAVDRAHARGLQEQFIAAGVAAGYQDANTTSVERDVIRRQFHDGRLKVVCSVGTMIVGVDWDIRCVIWARPTKSSMLFVQGSGRGIRTADGKEDCLARDTLVLTDRGEVKIQDVTLDHKLWDGVNFVRHRGAVCKGVRDVVTYDGLTATNDHRVMTDEGWLPLGEASRRRLRIACTGIGGMPIRFVKDRFSEDRRENVESTRRSGVRALWKSAYGAVSQYTKTARYDGMSALQWAPAGQGSAVALRAMPSTEITVRKSVGWWFRSLWRSRCRIQIFQRERSSSVGSGQSWNSKEQKFATGQDKQRRPLRARESSLGFASGEYEQHQEIGSAAQICCFPKNIPGSSICRYDVASPDPHGVIRQRNNQPVGIPIVQAKREVWDIFGSGPLQRFTANGKLVHNCLFLDHADNFLRLGFITDIHFDELDDGTIKRNGPSKPPQPKECPKCHYLRPAGSSTCANCGFVAVAQAGVIQRDGVLEEISKSGGSCKISKPRKTVIIGGTEIPFAEFFGMLKSYARIHEFKPGWASYRYKTAVGAWPDAYKHSPECEVSSAVSRWVIAHNIRYAKASAKKPTKRADEFANENM